MKRVLFLLLVSVFMLPAFHSEAQVQGTQTPTHYQELTKQQQRQVKRDLRKKARPELGINGQYTLWPQRFSYTCIRQYQLHPI